MVHTTAQDALWLIDGSALLYRSYYGLRPLYTSKGVPTQAIYGFCRAIQKIVTEYDPQSMVVIWDSKGKTIRHDEFKEYKATREAPPSDLFEQKERIIQILEAIELEQLAQTGFEADDIIGEMVKKYKGKNNVVVVGPDKDLYQLIDKTVIIYDPFKREFVDKQTFVERRGFEPEKLVFYHALLGDASDNIPGVKGIGKKSASELVGTFDSLKDLYANLDKIEKSRIVNALEANKENAFLSEKLFTLRPCEYTATQQDIAYDKSKWSAAADHFIELEFSSFLKGYTADKVVQEKATKAAPKAPEWKCHTVQTEGQLDEMIDAIKKAGEFSFDTETFGLRPLVDGLVGISFACSKKEAYYIPLRHEPELAIEPLQQLDETLVLEKIAPLFSDSNIKVYAQSAKFDQLALASGELIVREVDFDTLLAAGLVRKEWEKISLKQLSNRYLDESMQTFKQVCGKCKTFASVPLGAASTYAAHDALQTFKLVPVLRKELGKDAKLKKIFDDIDLPMAGVLYDMELRGIKLEPDQLADVGKDVGKKLSHIKSKIVTALKIQSQADDLNLNSPKQIEKLLFDDLKLPVVKKSSKGQRSTDHEVLIKLAELHPIPGLILTYRELFKLQSTYLDPLPKEINPKTGRIHTSYSQTLAITGRLSSSTPNLQNIPATKDYGIRIRQAFVAERGYRFISADYSQIELRILAHLSQDNKLLSVFENDEDIHTQTASQIFEVEPQKVTTEQRQVGKRINFSIMYGVTPYGLSKDLSIKPSVAKEYIDRYFEEYTGVASWMEKTVERGKKLGYVQTWMGRRRYVPGLHEKNQALYLGAKRVAINSPVQGTQAELMKKAMIELDEQLKSTKLDAHMILQIHDEVLIEVRNDQCERVEKLVQKILEDVVAWQTPLKVTLRKGENWGDVTK